jgi:rubrerythrin
LQTLYDADRARSEAENDAINAWQGERIEDAHGASYWDITHHPDGTVTAKPKASPYKQEMSWCELCNDERLEEDLNEDGRCPLCEEREEKNENGI